MIINTQKAINLLLASSFLFSFSASAAAKEPISSPEGKYLVARNFSTIPDDAFGEQIKRGYSLFTNSQQMRGKYVMNELNCTNCHLASGRKENAAPMWAAYMAYPAYRSKNDRINSFADRVQGCFSYSMNGIAPANDSPELIALASYSYWLAVGSMLDQQGLHDVAVPEISNEILMQGGLHKEFTLPAAIAKAYPIDKRNQLPGRGFKMLDKPALEPSSDRGKIVFNDHCAQCHGPDGQGYKANGVQSFPPLWGDNSYNWGAGMHNVDTAAYFIAENMPFAQSIKLTPQQAWDVATFMNSHERPIDPRKKK
ncbi:c-type cytochrome [Psychromonas sp.]|nr:c-type cytochrome [Psychromonas sp.]